jgi:hypothetical protein
VRRGELLAPAVPSLCYPEEKRMPYITSVERFHRRKGLLLGIETCLKIKFGAEGLKLMPEIREIYDHEVLEKILQAMETAASPEELRRVWVP